MSGFRVPRQFADKEIDPSQIWQADAGMPADDQATEPDAVEDAMGIPREDFLAGETWPREDGEEA